MPEYTAKVYRKDNTVYLILIRGKRREYIHRCIGFVINGNEIKSIDGKVEARLPFDVDPEIVIRALQTIGDWFIKRLSQGRGRIGYLTEIAIKHVVYMLCKEEKKKQGIKQTECLKQSEVKTSRGKVTWKAIYQLYSNASDLEKSLSEPNYWEGELPEECTVQVSETSSDK
ncbi:hypothetical protein EYM_04250 [Ignicoccus islandicus DSM 13165]|uniref:Uncharacterized protein n=1 Tax=Ignicoccus islandicus DSM 13165 TaxID=940295 RepID=A0A0U3FQ90_9CREN|nr:hypothetical protein [Ignicoccus islandicus]ALU12479.1 hypothetical protein EYM_04250 [Ignicoccus islandicus DSM 13165]